MVEKKVINLDEYNMLVHHLVADINPVKYKYVYGVPRGGCILAKDVSVRRNIPQVESLEGLNPHNVLVVDDLIDSGKTKEKYKDYDFKVLINKQTDEKYKDKWIEFWYEKTNEDDDSLVTRILERIGEDPNRPGLKDTPRRVLNMYEEVFRGYDLNKKPKITVFDNNDDGLVYDEMVVDKGSFYSHCEHHMVPFFGKYWFAYIPNKKILGISKVARLVDFYSARLQVQERLVYQIVDDLEKILQPKGIALVMEGKHLCKCMRGVKKDGTMLTSCLKGVFRTDAKARSEFLSIINKMNGGI